MEQSEFQNATRLRDSGSWDDTAREFHRLAAQSQNRDEKAALLVNEHRCYCDAGQLDQAEGVLKQIRELDPDEPVVRLIVDFGEACMNVQAEQPEKGLKKFEQILCRYADLLQDSHRYIYESIQKRRGVTFANLSKYVNAVPILKEASGFETLTPEDKQEVHFYLALCYEELRQNALAEAQYRAAIDLGLKNEFEAHAHYKIAINYFKAGAFAQTKQHLEIIVENGPSDIPNLPMRYVYEQLSRACHYLGERDNADRYMKMAKML
jgi:tetratricopeptide (TPR) repeat protein